MKLKLNLSAYNDIRLELDRKSVMKLIDKSKNGSHNFYICVCLQKDGARIDYQIPDLINAEIDRIIKASWLPEESKKQLLDIGISLQQTEGLDAFFMIEFLLSDSPVFDMSRAQIIEHIAQCYSGRTEVYSISILTWKFLNRFIIGKYGVDHGTAGYRLKVLYDFIEQIDEEMNLRKLGAVTTP